MKSIYHDEKNHIDIIEVKSPSETSTVFATQIKNFKNKKILDLIENKMKHLHLDCWEKQGSIPWTDYSKWIGNNFKFNKYLVGNLNLSEQAIMIWELPIFDESNPSNFPAKIDLTIIDNSKCYLIEFTYSNDKNKIINRIGNFVKKVESLKKILDPGTSVYKFLIGHNMNLELAQSVDSEIKQIKKDKDAVSFYILNNKEVLTGKKDKIIDLKELKSILSKITKKVKVYSDFELLQKNWLNVIDYFKWNEKNLIIK